MRESAKYETSRSLSKSLRLPLALTMMQFLSKGQLLDVLPRAQAPPAPLPVDQETVDKNRSSGRAGAESAHKRCGQISDHGPQFLFV